MGGVNPPGFDMGHISEVAPGSASVWVGGEDGLETFWFVWRVLSN